MRKKIMMLTIAIVLISAVFANGKDDGTGEVNLVFSNWWMSDPIRGKNMEAACQMFSEIYPNVKVSAPIVSSDKYWDQLYLDIASSSEGDVIAVDTGAGIISYDRARPGGTFIGLDDYIKGYVLPDGTKLEEDILLLDQMKRDGRTVALPYIWFVAENTAYRKSVLKDAGIDPAQLETWSGLMKAAEQLTVDTNGDGAVDQYGFAHPVKQEVLTRWWTMHYLWTAGGGIFPNEEGPYTAERLIFNCEENVKALEYLIELNKKAAPAGDRGFNDSRPMFESGELAMIQAALWTVGNFSADLKPEGAFENDLAFAPFPKYNLEGEEKDPVYVSWGNPLGISSKSKHPEEAFDFIAFMHSEKVQRMVSTTAAPTNKRVLDWYKSENPIRGDFLDLSLQYEMRIVPDIPQWNQFDLIIQQAFSAALLGASTPQEALDWGQQELKNILGE